MAFNRYLYPEQIKNVFYLGKHLPVQEKLHKYLEKV